MEKLVELGAKAELPGQALGQSEPHRPPPGTAPGPCRGSGGRPPGKHSMEKLVELGAKAELPGQALGQASCGGGRRP